MTNHLPIHLIVATTARADCPSLDALMDLKHDAEAECERLGVTLTSYQIEANHVRFGLACPQTATPSTIATSILEWLADRVAIDWKLCSVADRPQTKVPDTEDVAPLIGQLLSRDSRWPVIEHYLGAPTVMPEAISENVAASVRQTLRELGGVTEAIRHWADAADGERDRQIVQLLFTPWGRVERPRQRGEQFWPRWTAPSSREQHAIVELLERFGPWADDVHSAALSAATYQVPRRARPKRE